MLVLLIPTSEYSLSVELQRLSLRVTPAMRVHCYAPEPDEPEALKHQAERPRASSQGEQPDCWTLAPGLQQWSWGNKKKGLEGQHS